MKMRMVMIAALAAQLPVAGPAQASDLPREEAATQQPRFEKGPQLAQADREAAAAVRAAAAQPEEPRKKKRRSTGDKVLTGAAIVLGIGAVAVGGLLVAIFVS